MAIKLGVILIGVTDLNKSRPFYENVFGMEIVEFRPPFMQGNLNGVEFNIEENADYRHSDWADKNIGGRKSFSIQVDNIQSFLKKVKEFGGKIIEEPIKQSWGWYDAVISDLDGNEIVIEQEIVST